MVSYPPLFASTALETEMPWYARDLALRPALSSKDEQALLLQIAQSPHSPQAREARERLIEGCLWLVTRIARLYQPFGIDIADLVQEGNVALVKAIDHFQPQFGHRFHAYVTRGIRWALSNLVAKAWGDRYLAMDDTEPVASLRSRTLKALARDELDASACQQELPPLRVLSLHTLSDLEERDAESGKGSYAEDTDEGCGDPYTLFQRGERTRALSRALASLPPRERSVLIRYYLRDPHQTLPDIGKDLGLTPERVRQIKVRALQRLRQPRAARPLLACL